MSLFARKIDRAKWQKSEFLDNGEIPADAITICLKTTSDCLSVWEINTEAEIEDALLAIVSNYKDLETTDIVLLDPAFLEHHGIEFVQKDGITRFEAQKKSHQDLQKLSHRTLGIIAGHIVDGIKTEKMKRYTKGKLIEILRHATREGGKLPLECLDEKIQEAIR